MLAWVDGEPVAAEGVAGMLAAGDGHFTTLQVRGGRVQGLDLHVSRLGQAQREVFGRALDTDHVLGLVRRAFAGNDACDATLRVVLARPPGAGAVTVVLVSLGPAAVPPGAPVHLKSFVHERPFPDIKHLGTFPQSQLRRAAVAQGCDDALFVDAAGTISEGTFWNIGFWRDGGVVWPEAPALRGTCERLLQDGLAEAGVRQQTCTLRLGDLERFEGAFACNSRGVWPVARIDGTVLPVEADQRERLAAALSSRPWEPV